MDHVAETLRELAEARWQEGAVEPETVEKNYSPVADRIVAALRTVYDPEIPVNIYDLGLIYRIAEEDQGLVEIDMTLTAPGCPVAGEMVNQVQKAVAVVGGVRDVKVTLVFNPPWDTSKMSEEARLELNLI
jgi:FeS assembly SUF system protein